MQNIIEIQNLKKDYYTIDGEINAIDNINIKIQENNFVTIVGPSGCGKSTLLNIIANLDFATEGKIIFNKENIVIGYMLQTDALLPWKNVLDNACLGLEIQKKKNNDTIEYTKKLLKKYGLEEFIEKYPKDLSGGMKQRVALIRTLSIKPDILLLDEPFSALDYQTRLSVADDVHKIIKEENKTAVMITHDIAEAISLSDKVIILSNRPSTIKENIKLDFDKEKTPTKRRSDKNFSEYYEKIWKMIDKS